MTPRRFALAKQRLAQRQPDLTVLMDGVHKTHNFSAILRSCDAVGVYEAHHVVGRSRTPLASGTAQGANKWVHVRRHRDIGSAAAVLKERGFRLFAAHLSDAAVDYRSLDYTPPTAFVMGTEKFGISDDTLAHCDGEIVIPMQGWVESLNVSVAAALLLFEAQRQRLEVELYDECRLEREPYDKTLFEWLHPKLAQYCREKKLAYPPLNEDGEPASPLPGSSSNPWGTAGDAESQQP